ncbi:hypothetical protein GW796_08495 [archaeon]|nr:hypothetical protein [archaeon]
MKYKIFVVWLLSFFCMLPVFAADTSLLTPADIKTGLISSMEKDGYLSQKMAGEVAQKYITEIDKNTLLTKVDSSKPKTKEQIKELEKSSVSWSQYFSWINFMKVVGVIFLLLAFGGVIKKIIYGLWKFIVAIPVIIYQGTFISCGLLGIIYPTLIWESQSFYIALFSSFANIMVLGWIITSHPKLQLLIKRIFNWGIPIGCVISFGGMLYFGILAMVYQSSIFGFFAAVCISGVFSFGLSYRPGVLTLYFKEEMLSSVVFGHIFVLIGYVFAFQMVPEYTSYFNDGIQYYCTIAICVALLTGSSPFYRSDSAIGYTLIFIFLACLATLGYFFYDFKVIASIIFIFFTLFVLEWVSYVGYKGSVILGSALLGGSLFGLSMLFEKYGSMIILHL